MSGGLKGALFGAAIGVFLAIAIFAMAIAVLSLALWLPGVLGGWVFYTATFVSCVALCAAIGAGGGFSQ